MFSEHRYLCPNMQKAVMPYPRATTFACNKSERSTPFSSEENFQTCSLYTDQLVIGQAHTL